MTSETLHRYSSYRAACKQSGVALGVVILLVGALGKLDAASLLYAALPLLLLGLVDAAYAGQERRCLELLRNKKGNDELAALAPEGAGAGVVRTTQAALSLAVWPFYLALGGIVVAGSGVRAPAPEGADHRVIHTAAVAPVAKAGCGSGGCGKAGGCGSGGCGASAGKSCSCGGGAKSASTPMQAKPVFPTTTRSMPVQVAPPRPPTGFAPPVRPASNPIIQRVGTPAIQQPARRLVQPAPIGFPASATPAPIVPAAGGTPQVEEQR